MMSNCAFIQRHVISLKQGTNRLAHRFTHTAYTQGTIQIKVVGCVVCGNTKLRALEIT